MAVRPIGIVYFLVVSMAQYVIISGAKNMDLYCGACKAIVDEVEYSVSKIDPRKMIDVGSFRLDPNGKQKSVKVPYARSEVHLTEELENVCSKMNSYAESRTKSGKRKYVRTSSRDGEALDLSNISLSQDIVKNLRFAVPLARSESQLTDLLEKVCDDISSDYVQSKDKESGKMRLKRMVTHDGKMATDVDFQALMQNAQTAGDKPPDTDSKKVKFICESIIEEHEEDFIKSFANADKDTVAKVCSEIGEYCEEDEEEDEKDEEEPAEDDEKDEL